MVAIFVLATILAFVLIDFFVQRARRAKTGGAQQSSRLPVADQFLIPRGYFFSKGHSWIELLFSGNVRIGIDDFIQKLVGPMDGLVIAPTDTAIQKGETLCTIKCGDRTLSIPSPMTGTVLEVNEESRRNPSAINADPYGAGWIAVIEPTNLAAELPANTVAEGAARWLRKEISRFRDFIQEFGRPDTALPAGATLLDGGMPVAGILGMTDERTWSRFEREFLVSQND